MVSWRWPLDGARIFAMHEADFAHDHEELYAKSSDLEGLEVLSLLSVGIDIGTSTSHIVFSLLKLRREGGFSTRFRVFERAIVWTSAVRLTPYLSATQIDFEALRAWIEASYDLAGFAPDDVETGAVVLTGEALAKENARPILEYFSQASGKFVCASAGPHHEALLAAYGSGSVQLSLAQSATVLNVDIGGGTTKLALIEKGTVTHTAAISIGARLIAFDTSGRVTRLEKAGEWLAAAAGRPVALDRPLYASARQAIAATAAGILTGVLKGAPDSFARPLWITEPIALEPQKIDHIIFSGGVSEYIHEHTRTAFGDLGRDLGRALQGFARGLQPGVLQEPLQGIRATVIGAGSHTVQVSGTTSFAGDEQLLPLRGLKAVRLAYRPGTPFADAITQAFQRFDVPGFGAGLMLSIAINSDLEYTDLRAMADGIAFVANGHPTAPVIVNIELDVAQSLGHILRSELHLPNPLLVIDGVTLGDLDYVDIGCALGAVQVFPVTVKSLLFPAGL